MNIKILVAYHKISTLYKDEILTPIHVGRAIAKRDTEDYKWLLENAIGDDTGDNISNKNASYNELTALYWAWKNYDKLGNPDYIGLEHYRRHLIFDVDDFSIVKKVNKIDDNYLEQVCKYSKENIEKILSKGDFIFNQGRVSSILGQYKAHHRIEDLERAVSIASKKYPEYKSSCQEYLKRSYGCFANMFIFPKEMFFRYCSWLFSILEEFENEVDLTNRRLFISERLTGIFVYHEIKRRHKKGIPLSSTFVNEKLSVDVGYVANKNNIFQIAVSMHSLLKNIKYPDICVNFHLIYQDKAIDTKCLDAMKGKVSKIDWTFVDPTKIEEKYLPLYLGEIFPSVGKILLLDTNTIVFSSIDIIWEACNTFEFMYVYSKENNKQICCLNLKLMRYYKIVDDLNVDKYDSVHTYFTSLYPENCHIMADWVISYVTKEVDGNGLYQNRSRRDEEMSRQVWTKCMLHFDEGMEPWDTPRNCFNIYWWDNAAEIPSAIPFINIDIEKFIDDFEAMNKEYFYTQLVNEGYLPIPSADDDRDFVQDAYAHRATQKNISVPKPGRPMKRPSIFRRLYRKVKNKLKRIVKRMLRRRL